MILQGCGCEELVAAKLCGRSTWCGHGDLPQLTYSGDGDPVSLAFVL